MKKDSAKAIYNCMSAVTAIDGECHQKEKRVLNKFKKKYNLGDGLKDPRDLIKNQKKCEDVFTDNFFYLLENADLSTVYYLLHNCNEIADADNTIHDKEESLLQLIQKGVGDGKFFITKENFEWDDQQKKVINKSVEDRILVEAPPGAGKTEIVAKKVFDMIESKKIRPREILLISFTNSAVREMRERIFNYSQINGVKFPTGLNISTIDSKAFTLNSALRDDYVIRGGYEKNIQDFLKILQGNSVDFLYEWDELKHIFIDEAQDLVGLRKDVCKEFIRLANPNTGISIFGDSCQQIYPWTTSENPVLSDEEKISLINVIEKEHKNNFEKIELNTIHRTNNEFLKILLDDMRLNILSSPDQDEIKSSHGQIENEEENLFEIDAGDDYLFLFRSNSEVIDAAYNLISAKKIFRFKANSHQYPKYIKSWVAKLIIYSNKNNLETVKKAEFFEFIKTISSRHMIGDRAKEYMWKILSLYSAHDQDVISIADLIEELNKENKNNELYNEDFGFRGPKLSTIHAAKGSQAENVIINNLTKKDKVNQEESKIIFVGISRAKQNLRTSSVPRKRYFQMFEDLERKNNCYAANRNLNRKWRMVSNYRNVSNFKEKPVYIMEMGLSGDYNPNSIIDQRNISFEEAKKTQDFLNSLYLGNSNIKVFAERQDIVSREFKIYAESIEGIFNLGVFSSQIIDNALNVGGKWLKTKKFIPPLRIDNISILDIASCTLNQDNIDDRKNYFKPFLEQEAWLYPVIYGLGKFTLEPRKK